MGRDLEDISKWAYILGDDIDDYVVNIWICKGNKDVCYN